MVDSEVPRVDYWHLYTDEHGVSRQRRCAFTEFERRSISEPASPQWIGRRTEGSMSTLLTVLPAGWIGEWHENPQPQWIIALSGRWFVESMDGQRIEMGPGELSFGADQGTRERNGRKGHLSGAVGDLPAVLWLVQLARLPAAPLPCAFS
ncbi:MAG: cupin domain-containing protein [Steroidobacteraceae bacterium]